MKYNDDPIWRRALISLGLFLMNFSERFHDLSKEINWRDHIGWKIDALGGRIFHLGHNGSLDEARMILDGEIPWSSLAPDDQDAWKPLLEPETFARDVQGQLWSLEDEVSAVAGHPLRRFLPGHENVAFRRHVSEIREALRELHRITVRAQHIGGYDRLMIEDRKAA
jgi:hypothetical protein